MVVVSLSLVVIKAGDIEKLKNFCEKIGLEFKQEQHGKGPVHWAALVGDTVFEIYPLRTGERVDKIRLGFRVEDLDAVVAKLIANGYRVLTPLQHRGTGYIAIAKDPDGRTIELSQN